MVIIRWRDKRPTFVVEEREQGAFNDPPRKVLPGKVGIVANFERRILSSERPEHFAGLSRDLVG